VFKFFTIALPTRPLCPATKILLVNSIWYIMI
jgi:hypothetical protein